LTISHLRTESQCKIDVPKVNGDDTIVIIGSKENIVVAKNMIFEILINLRKEQNNQFFVGDSLLVKPIVKEGQTSTEIYFSEND
ncbi:20641_t:CDS:2, partial [Entrophospora sp. SA101]